MEDCPDCTTVPCWRHRKSQDLDLTDKSADKSAHKSAADLLRISQTLTVSAPVPITVQGVIEALTLRAVAAEKDRDFWRDRFDTLQSRNSDLVRHNRRLRHEQLVIEELRRVALQLTERVAVLERVAVKLHEEIELSEDECYVIESIYGRAAVEMPEDLKKEKGNT